MEMKIIWAAAMLFAGWLLAYLFGRQLLFNFKVAYPLIKKMNETSESLIDPNSKKYTATSVVTCLVVSIIAIAAVVFLCRKKIYLMLSFIAGVLICMFMLIGKIKPEIRQFFDNFCETYYRFVPDDELRTAMYNKKPSQMKLRLHDMDLSTAFIPDFEDNK